MGDSEREHIKDRTAGSGGWRNFEGTLRYLNSVLTLLEVEDAVLLDGLVGVLLH